MYNHVFSNNKYNLIHNNCVQSILCKIDIFSYTYFFFFFANGGAGDEEWGG